MTFLLGVGLLAIGFALGVIVTTAVDEIRGRPSHRLPTANGDHVKKEFDPETFPAQFAMFVAGLPLRLAERLTVDQRANLLRDVRVFLHQQRVPLVVQARLTDRIMEPYVTAPVHDPDGPRGTLTDAERAEIERKWSEAIGINIKRPN